MNIVVLLLRIAVTLTFFILALVGPYAVLQLRKFIKRYRTAHLILEARVENLEQWRNKHESN